MGEKRGAGRGVGVGGGGNGSGFREIRYTIYLPFNTVQCTYRGFSTLARILLVIHNMYAMYYTYI
jgi:hypothetical protein